MTRRERLKVIFNGTIPDRPAVKIWGAGPGAPLHNPGFERVRQLALAKTDLMVSAGSPFNVYAGRFAKERITWVEKPTADPEWVVVDKTYDTPLGKLRELSHLSKVGKPGYVHEHLLKEPDDIRKLLAMPYEPYPFEPEPYCRADAAVGDAGIAMVGLDHAAYALQRLAGSENFALWSVTDEELLLEAVACFAKRIHEHARAAVAGGLGKAVFGWVGPEICIPPLMSPFAFDIYVAAFDRQLIADIHDAGGHVWVHCHGKMRPVLERFVGMGVDVLNPIEPPPMGDVTMAEAFAMVGDRMGLEGGVETHDLMTAPRERIHELVHAVIDAGRGRRCILGPSSGYTESVSPTDIEIENWLYFIDEGVRYAEGSNQ